jgi:hypothetical protein
MQRFVPVSQTHGRYHEFTQILRVREAYELIARGTGERSCLVRHVYEDDEGA